MSLNAVTEAVVACRDVAASVDFHTRAFGLDVVERGPSGALLGAPGGATGRLRLVPAPRAAAAEPDPRIWDIGPRLLGIYSRDLHRSAGMIDAAGGRTRPVVSYPYGEASLSECVALGTDGLWWTLPQADAGHRPSPALDGDPQRLHGELHSAVVVPDDHDQALRFFVDGGGLRVLFDGALTGEPFERMTGMPPGAGLRLSFLVCADQAPARIEIMSFTGVDAEDLSDRELGLRRVVFATDDADSTVRDLLAHGGVRRGAHLVSGPAGLQVELRTSPGGHR